MHTAPSKEHFPKTINEFVERYGEYHELPEDENTQSIAILIDGETKVGKGQLLHYIEAGIERQTDLFVLAGIHAAAQAQFGDNPMHLFNSGSRSEPVISMLQLRASMRFKGVETVSAGNMFRVLAHIYNAEEGRITEFTSALIPEMRRLQERAGFLEYLQNDPVIGQSVSEVAQVNGAHELASVAFVDAFSNVIARQGWCGIGDGRNPDRHLSTNGAFNDGRVKPEEVVPLFMECPPHVAAARMSGDYDNNLSTILYRRALDLKREKFPYVPPNSISNPDAWRRQLGPNASKIMPTYLRINNGEGVLREDLQEIGAVIGAVALDLSAYLRNPGTEWAITNQ